MSFDLGVTTEDYASEDQSWLGSAHGTEICFPITLDADKFLATFTDGVVPSGVVLGVITASGLAAPYTDAATHGAGSDTAIGHLYTTANLKGTTAGTAKDQVAAVFWHGRVKESRLPTGHGLTAAAKADLAQIRYSA